MCSNLSGFMQPVTLPATDNYVVVVDPATSNTGTADVTPTDTP